MGSTAERTVEPALRRTADDLWLLFALTWGTAIVLHVIGNPRLGPWWGRALVGLAGVVLLARPRQHAAAAVAAVAVLAGVWLEAPVLGNHWLLHGFIAAVVLGGLATRPHGAGALIVRIGGALRLVLLAFYAFAAFAKVNHDFFDPAVSCATVFFRRSAASWGAGQFVDGLSSPVLAIVAVGVVAVELAIPVLLLVRRTRSIGVVVALVFHLVLALDRTHQFFDFSAVLTALFLLFLPAGGVQDAIDRSRRLRGAVARRWPSAPELARLAALAGAALGVALAAGPERWPVAPPLRAAGLAFWLPAGVAAIAFAATAVRAEAGRARPLFPASANRALLVIPCLAVINGVTPYVELKTGTSWNMYSNLAVIDGSSNHLLVRRGLPVTDAHERLVRIVDAEGVDLGVYVGTDWLLPEVMLRDHLADREGAVVHGEVDGEPVRYVGGSGDGRAEWRQKLQVFRAVDGQGPVSCQTGFGPAR